MRKPIYGNIPVVISEEQIAEMRELYAQVRQIKSSHAYSTLCLGDTTKEERAFFASVGDINNGRSYAEEQAEVEHFYGCLMRGNRCTRHNMNLLIGWYISASALKKSA